MQKPNESSESSPSCGQPSPTSPPGSLPGLVRVRSKASPREAAALQDALNSQPSMFLPLSPMMVADQTAQEFYLNDPKGVLNSHDRLHPLQDLSECEDEWSGRYPRLIRLQRRLRGQRYHEGMP